MQHVSTAGSRRRRAALPRGAALLGAERRSKFRRGLDCFASLAMTASHRLRAAGYCGRGARSSSLIATTAEQGAFMHFVLTAALVIAGASVAVAQPTSPNGVKTLSPEGAIKPTGTWALGTRAGDFVYVAGMRASIPRPIRWCKATRRGSARRSST